VHGIQRKAAIAAVAMVSAIVALPVSAQTKAAAHKTKVAKTEQPAPAADDTPKATPIGSPAAWFPADAYPPEAKAAGLQGRTAFTLDLDTKGRITSCNITSSSGSPLLDSTTCTLLVTNGRFQPAHNAAGQAVAGTWSSAMVWQLAAPEAPAPDTIDDFNGVSPAQAYNDSLTEQAHAAAAASDSDSDHSQGGGQDDQ
jgi:TonB family protein